MADYFKIRYRIGDINYWLKIMEPLKLIVGQTLVITEIGISNGTFETRLDVPFIFTLDSDGRDIAFFRENPSIRGKNELITLETIKAGTGLLKIYYRDESITIYLTAYNPYLNS